MVSRRRRRGAAWLAALAVAGLAIRGTGATSEQAATRPLDALRKQRASEGAGPRRPLSDATRPASLPAPALTEPFEIGGALYDPSRIPQAVVSLLALMRIGIESSPTAAGPGLRLDESEVRSLIAMADQDITQAGDIENLPFTFTDLHKAVASLLPSMSVEQLAEAYTRAYESHPDALAAKVMMGQPITPDTRLTRAHLWLLLMDGFAGPAQGTWGTADATLPDLPSPQPAWSVPEWKELLARFPLVAADRLLSVESPSSLVQGAKGPGAAGQVTVRMAPKLPPLVSRLTGKTLLPARGGSLAGLDVTWELPEDSMLRSLGTVPADVGQPRRVGPNGTASFSYQPGASATRGAGRLITASGTVDATTDGCPLVKAAYDTPPQICGFMWGGSRVRARIPVGWWTPAWVDLDITNVSDVTLDVRGSPIRTGAKREVNDWVHGTLALQPDGTFQGLVEAEAWGQQTMPAPRCTGMSVGSQQLYVIGTVVDGFGPTHPAASYVWTNGANVAGASMASEPPDGHLSLEFFPATEPTFSALFGSDPCQSLIPADPSQLGHGATQFLPFNDAQWTIPHAAYGVAFKKSGITRYEDRTSARTIAGSSVWYVTLEYKTAP